MEDKQQTNKLSVYLIKDGLSDITDFFDEPDAVTSTEISDVATLFYSSSEPSTPGWLTKFFGNSVADQLKSVLYTAYVSAALIIDVEIETGVSRKFAVTFGLGGWQLLKSGSYEERFGLMATLNMVKPDSIRSIDKSNMGLAPKQAREQVIAASEMADFGVDIEQDLVRSVTGKCVDVKHGSTITGKDSLHISSKVDITNLPDRLRAYYLASRMDIYKENFSWIDHIAEVKDSVKITELNDILVSKLNSTEYGGAWLAVPEVIDWSDVKGFIFHGDIDSFSTDLDLDMLLGSLSERGKDIDIESLKKQKVAVLNESNNGEYRKWSAFSCIYAEVDHGNNLYTLNNAKWYCVEKTFVEQINDAYESILDVSEVLPPFIAAMDTSEGSYNTRIAGGLGLTLMDAKNISFGGGHSKIEFCDIFDYKGHILYHVKKYGGSSVLSHLFNQGLVSAQLMLSEESFREAVNEKLPPTEIFNPTSEKPLVQDYEVIFGVISKSKNKLNLPFFSKVSLKNAKQTLELYGIKKVRLVKIQADE